MKRIHYLTITLLLQGVFIMFMNFSITKFNDTALFQNYSLMINLIVGIITVMMILSLKDVQKFANKEVELMINKKNLENIESMINVLRIQRHDHLNQIQTLQSMIYLGEIDAATTFLSGITKSYHNHDKILRLGDPGLTSLVNIKIEVANSKGIDLRVTVKEKMAPGSFDSWDLCSIVGNLLDNAIEYVYETSLPDKIILLDIEKESDTYLIRTSNFINQSIDVDKIFTMGYSTKKASGRGYGLFIAKQLVEKYGGTLTAKQGSGKLNGITSDKIEFTVVMGG